MTRNKRRAKPSEFSTPAFIGALREKSRRRRAALSDLAGATAGPELLRNDPNVELSIVYLPVDRLKPPARRLRVRDEAHIREIARCMSVVGFVEPVLVGAGDTIVHGVARWEAAKMLGHSEVPCVRVDHLSQKDQRLLRLATNRLAEKGRWDLNELKIEFEELILLDAPIEITGFGADDVDQIVMVEGAEAVEVGPLAPREGAVAITRPGDLWQLGDHRVICGDARDPDIMRRLMEDAAPVRVTLTDEPYNVTIAGNVTGGAHREFAMASGEMSPEEFGAFNGQWIASVLPYLAKGGLLGTFIDWRGAPIVHAAALGQGLTALNLIVWAKTNAGMGSFYRSQHELLPLFKKGDAPHINNVQLGKGGRWRSNLWTYPGASSLGSDARRGLVDHPTVKPTAMLEDALLDITNRGEIVLDPFLGSGSTLIAAQNVGRICHGVEIDPLYVDVIIRRFQALTGKDAVNVDTGETFQQRVAIDAETHRPDAE